MLLRFWNRNSRSLSFALQTKFWPKIRPLRRCICYEPNSRKLFWSSTSKCVVIWFWKFYIQPKRKIFKPYYQSCYHIAVSFAVIIIILCLLCFAFYARFPLGYKWRYLAIIFWRYLTIILKISVIRFTHIKSEFWSSFDSMSDSEGKDILFLELVVLFKMKKKKRRKRKNGKENYFVNEKKKDHSTT